MNIRDTLIKYLTMNEFGILDDFYDFYIMESENLLTSRKILSKNEIDKILMKYCDDGLISYENDKFHPRHLLIEVNTIEKSNLKRDLDLRKEDFLWQIEMNIEMNFAKFEFNTKDIFDLLDQNLRDKLPHLNNAILDENLIYIRWYFGSTQVDIWIRNNSIKISSSIHPKKSDFIDLIDYLNRDILAHPDQQKIILMFPQISGLYYSYTNLRKIFHNRFNISGINFKIRDIKFLRGSLDIL